MVTASRPLAWMAGLLLSTVALLAHASPAARALGYDDARLLLERTQFAASDAEIRQYAKLTRSSAVDKLLADAQAMARTPPPNWVNDPIRWPRELRELSEDERKAYRRDLFTKGVELREWWYREMLTTSSPLSEKMTLFWHNHFVSSQQKVRPNQLLYRQNLILRRNALGNFATLLHQVSKDPAMLIYLDGATSKKEQPNENFAREVMELFTLGEGNYSEKDIKEAARAFTGWSIDRDTGDFKFRPFFHDYGYKNVLGHVDNYDGDAALDVLLEQPECARFITRKLWREFISPAPDEKEVDRMAALFRNSGYDIKTLMRALLTSNAFYAEKNRASLVKSPVELIVGTLKQLDIQLSDLRPVVFGGAALGQNIFSPPNVKGWPGGDTWINSSTLLLRKQFLEGLFRSQEMVPQGAMANQADTGVAQLTGGDRLTNRVLPNKTIEAEQWLGTLPGDDTQRKSLLPRLLLARAPQNPPDPNFDAIDTLRSLMRDPVYQLK